MYLKQIRIKDMGPVETLAIDLPFSDEGNPEPIALVGTNGSGKTILLAHIADALHEYAAKAFVDALPPLGQGHSYFMVGSSTHVRIGVAGGFCYLKFDADGTCAQYICKSGKLPFEDCKTATGGLLTGPLGSWDDDGNYKGTDWDDRKQINNQFQTQSHCFFPANRFETPHWLNVEALEKAGKYASLKERFASNMDAPIMVDHASSLNQQWLLDVMLDAYLYHKQPAIAHPQQNAINRMIQEILRRPDIRFGIGPRTSPNRISIVSDDGQENIETVCPSLDHLSAGQAVLLSLFISIIRYADKTGASSPEAIKGLILIDEADMHLHIDLQYEVFPKLIKLFPKVQFIFTSHSPLLLLGMKEEFSEAFHIVEMPTGSRIAPEAFSEFASAFRVLKETRAFEDHVADSINALTKPIVFVEGPTDVKYLQKAFTVFDKKDLLSEFDVQRIGVDDCKGGKGDGKDSLSKASSFVLAHPEIALQKILFLFDHDAGQKTIDSRNVFVRSLEKNDANNVIKNGIENLFPPDILQTLKDDGYWEEKKSLKEDGKEVTIRSPNKARICQYICEERSVNPEQEQKDFGNFQKIVSEIEKFLLFLGENEEEQQ